MISLVFRNIFRLVFLVILQVGILNYVQLGGYFNPYLYILFILLLPFETPKWLLLISSFVLGFSVDIFSGTPGLHTSACLLMAFCRPGVLGLVASRQEYEPGIQPLIRDLGFKWFFSYSFILVSIHHILLFYLEAFSFSEFFQTFFHALLNILFTMLIIVLSQFVIYRPKK